MITTFSSRKTLKRRAKGSTITGACPPSGIPTSLTSRGVVLGLDFIRYYVAA